MNEGNGKNQDKLNQYRMNIFVCMNLKRWLQMIALFVAPERWFMLVWPSPVIWTFNQYYVQAKSLENDTVSSPCNIQDKLKRQRQQLLGGSDTQVSSKYKW